MLARASDLHEVGQRRRATGERVGRGARGHRVGRRLQHRVGQRHEALHGLVDRLVLSTVVALSTRPTHLAMSTRANSKRNGGDGKEARQVRRTGSGIFSQSDALSLASSRFASANCSRMVGFLTRFSSASSFSRASLPSDKRKYGQHTEAGMQSATVARAAETQDSQRGKLRITAR